MFYTRIIVLCLCILSYLPTYPKATKVKIKISPEETVRIVDSLKRQLLLPLPDGMRMVVTYKLSGILEAKSPSEALLYAKECLEISERTGDKYMQIKVLNAIGVLYQLMSDYTKAISYYFKALKLTEEANKVQPQIAILTNIGTSYVVLKRYNLAQKYYSDALALYQKHPNVRGINDVYNNWGLMLIHQKKDKESIAYFLKAITSKEDLPDGVYVNLGLAYTNLNQFDQAIAAYNKALELAKDEVYEQSVLHGSLGNLYIQTGDFKKAKDLLFKAKDIAEQSGLGMTLEDVYLTIARLYKKQGNYKTAYVYQEKYVALKDSLHDDKITKQANEMQAKYEADKKDEQIKLLHKDKLLVEAKSEKVGMMRNFFILAFTLVMITSIILYRNISLKKKVNTVLKQKNDELNERNTLIEKQKIHIEKINAELNKYNKKLLIENITAKYEVLKSKVNPHFLFNSLTTLSAIIMEDPRRAIKYVEHFARLYRMILETGENKLISLDQEKEIIKSYLYLQEVRHNNNIIVSMDIDNYSCYVPPFALQLMIENAIKHNVISARNKLYITIEMIDSYIWIRNNLCRREVEIESTSTGQKNIVDRYKLISSIEPVFTETEDEYIVKLPVVTLTEQIEQPVGV